MEEEEDLKGRIVDHGMTRKGEEDEKGGNREDEGQKAKQNFSSA